MFKLANEEFLATAKELFQQHKGDLGLTVDPDKVIFMRCDKKSKDKRKIAYCRMISNEYELLTEKKFFIVVMSRNFDDLASDKEKRYAILHELKHCDYNKDDDKYGIVKHDLENFHQMIIDPRWNLELAQDKTVKNENNTGSPNVPS